MRYTVRHNVTFTLSGSCWLLIDCVGTDRGKNEPSYTHKRMDHDHADAEYRQQKEATCNRTRITTHRMRCHMGSPTRVTFVCG
jgi:hypothetical protein